MRWRLLAAVTVGGVMAGVAVGAGIERGWHEGPVAAAAARVLGPAFDAPVVLALPDALAAHVRGPTLIVYFSPTCPHCRNVAPEIAALADRIGPGAAVVGVASGISDAADVRSFARTFGWKFPIVHDGDRAIAAALGARSTPAATLVVPEDGRFVVRDAWYPYGPGSDVLVEMRLASDPWSVFRPDRYLGTRACGACHVHELESWLLSHHSVAWQTLVRQEKQDDPSCNGCHVTGKGRPGGWTGEATPHLVDVGCEACHGPSGPHDGQRTEPADTCTGCHDAEHSIHFTYAKGLPLLDHFRTTAMTPEEVRRARAALLDGEAPRELLAFTGGAYVGSAACASCHPEATAHWEGSPHARAMATLERDGAHEQVQCVRCHAVQKSTGPVPDTLSDFHTAEGVGCEACHGPGAAHVAAGGGTDNIVGLGKSCPVCVVEAVCTSCHTTAWDPTWNLERDLPKVRHRP